jgi:uncharacterized protein (TIGR02444 family)
MATEDDDAAARFWAFALDRYSRPEVARLCLELQDRHGLDVNMLLLCLWRATAMETLNAAQIRLLAEAAGPWNRAVVHPLRSIRLLLRTPEALDADGRVAAACRAAVRAAELEAERTAQALLMARLETVAPAVAGPPAAAARASFRAYVAASGLPAPPPAMDQLVEAALGQSS